MIPQGEQRGGGTKNGLWHRVDEEELVVVLVVVGAAAGGGVLKRWSSSRVLLLAALLSQLASARDSKSSVHTVYSSVSFV